MNRRGQNIFCSIAIDLNPSGLCMCGCGATAPIAKRTDKRTGVIKGLPQKFLKGHCNRRYRPESVGPNLSGFCECGCGLPTPIAKQTRSARGWVSGRPTRFLPYHRVKGPNRVQHRSDGTSIIFLDHKDGALECIIDTPDYPRVAKSRWHAAQVPDTLTFYVHGSNGARIHRLILPGFAQVDHADLNPLNNRRRNLRPANQSQNSANQLKQRGDYTSAYIGVHWDRKRQKFVASARVNQRLDTLGSFDNEIEAAKVRDAFVREQHAEYARLNFPEERHNGGEQEAAA